MTGKSKSFTRVLDLSCLPLLLWSKPTFHTIALADQPRIIRICFAQEFPHVGLFKVRFRTQLYFSGQVMKEASEEASRLGQVHLLSKDSMRMSQDHLQTAPEGSV